MSEEPLELVRRILSEGMPALHRLIASMAPDVVWDTSTYEGWPEQAEYRGLDQFVGFLQKWVEPYEEWGIEVEDIVDGHGGTVVAVLNQKGRLRDTDSWVEMDYALVYTIQDGQVQRCRMYATAEKALEAAGIAGRPTHS